jgi:hypothetical protein
MHEDSQETFISVEKNWKLLLQAAVEEAAREGVEAGEIEEQLEGEIEQYYVNHGDLENPDPDNVYDMIKDKELGL